MFTTSDYDFSHDNNRNIKFTDIYFNRYISSSIIYQHHIFLLNKYLPMVWAPIFYFRQAWFALEWHEVYQPLP